MMNRRTLLATTSAALATAAAASDASAAPIVESLDVHINPAEMTERQKQAHAVRFPKLDDNSLMDFTEGFKKAMGRKAADPEYTRHIQAFLKAHGQNTLDDTTLSHEACFNLMISDPVYAARQRLATSAQHLMWDRSTRAFHRDPEHYFAEMEKTDKAGPGTLELNPDMFIPDYARHEIHTQPGGYVGDPFGGWAYHWALTLAFFTGQSDHDEIFTNVTQAHPKPADGQVRRILDLGCGSGISTTALKERFPNAEVWGIDVGGPMVRYSHYRAVKLNSEVHFAQRLAENNKFPDNHFDLVTDHIVFHEVTGEVAKKIVAETYRVLRPGGVFSHADVPTVGDPSPPSNTPLAKASAWSNHRHNFEPWFFEYTLNDFPDLLRKTGFKVDVNLPSTRGGMYPGVAGVKPV